MFRRICLLMIIVVFMTVAPGRTRADDTAVDARIAVPDAATQKRTEGLIQQLYGSKMAAAKSADERATLEATLLTTADESGSDSAGRYGLLQATRTFAIAAGDVSSADSATQKIAAVFKVGAAAIALETFTGLTKTIKTAEDARDLCRLVDEAIDSAFTQNDFTGAKDLAGCGVTAAKARGSLALLARCTQRNAAIAEPPAAFDQVVAASLQLSKKPDDPAANFTVGRYLAAQQQWNRALPMLAKSSDQAAHDAAVKELKSTTESPAILSVADQWFNLSTTQTEPLKGAMQLHAETWYQRVGSDLPGLQQLRVKTQLETIDKAYPFRATVSEMSWKQNDPTSRLLPKNQGFCVLSWLGGRFDGYGERVGTSIGTDDQWINEGYCHQADLLFKCQIYRTGPRSGYHSDVTVYRWNKGDEKVKMIRKDEGICLLATVSGHFQGKGEHIDITPGDDGFWYLGGASGQSELNASAVGIRFADFKAVATKPREFTWRCGERPIKMQPVDEGICGLLAVGGFFKDEHPRLGMRLGDDGYWYLDGKADRNVDIAVRAIAFKYPADAK